MTGSGKKIRLRKMVAFDKAATAPAEAEKAPAQMPLTPAQEAAMEALKQAMISPAEDPRRMGQIHDAIYTLTKGEEGLPDARIQQEIDTFLKEHDTQEPAQKSGGTLSRIFGNKPAPKTPASLPPLKGRNGPRPGY
jgi:hypothetical protein